MKISVSLVLMAVWMIALTVLVGKLLYDQQRAVTLTVATDKVATVGAEATTPELASLSAQVDALELEVTRMSNLVIGGVGQGSPAPVNVSQPTTAASPPREFILPLGSGSTDNRDWTPITAASVEFNPAKYQPLRKIRFEAAGSIISGEVHVLLTDITHNVTYYNAELIFNSSTPTWKRSQPITLSSSPSQLQVQILSTNGEMAVLNDSRLVVEVGN